MVSQLKCTRNFRWKKTKQKLFRLTNTQWPISNPPQFFFLFRCFALFFMLSVYLFTFFVSFLFLYLCYHKYGKKLLHDYQFVNKNTLFLFVCYRLYVNRIENFFYLLHTIPAESSFNAEFTFIIVMIFLFLLFLISCSLPLSGLRACNILIFAIIPFHYFQTLNWIPNKLQAISLLIVSFCIQFNMYFIDWVRTRVVCRCSYNLVDYLSHFVGIWLGVDQFQIQNRIHAQINKRKHMYTLFTLSQKLSLSRCASHNI